jgi:hypothetical protein
MHDEHTHHAHRHLHHLVGVRVVHERAALPELKFVDEGLPRLDVRLRHAADPVHSVRQQHAVPVNRRVLGQLVGDEDAHLVAFDRLDCRSRRLTVVAPQVHLHARCEFAHHRLGNEVELLPVAVHAPGQSPAVERDDRLIVGAAHRKDRRLHRRRLRGWCFGDARRLHTPADRGCTRQHRGAAEKASARNHGLLLAQYGPPVSLADAATGLARSFLLPDRPPATAAFRFTVASQKSRFASIAVIVAAMRWRASASSENTSISIAL